MIQKQGKSYLIIKRLFDIAFSFFGLLFLSPIILIVALAILLDDGRPIFFRQTRSGKNGKNFTMLKFRSMVKENDIYDFEKKNEYTGIGKFLRKTSLDELPQLINILKGEMSFIGPRPWIPEYYKRMNAKQRRRYDVLPGLTGLAQASGRNNLTIIDKINFDLEYIKNLSLREDIKVIFLTIKAVFSKVGASAGKNVVKEELDYLEETVEVEPEEIDLR